MPWESLPKYLCSTIFTILLEDSDKKDRPGFATVSQQWRDFFEPIFFRRLVIDEADLNMLSLVTKGSKGFRFFYFRYIWLRLKLAPYTCKDCLTSEPRHIIHQNNARFTRAVYKLLGILARGNHIYRHRGITLQLSAHSPSDCRHRYRDFRMDDKYPCITGEDLVDKGEFHKQHRDLSVKYIKDMYPEVVSHQYRAYQLPEMDRFRSTEPLKFDFGKPLFRWSDTSHEPVDTEMVLPTVKLVKALVIRRQFYRNISSSALAKLLRESLPRLQTFRDERWLAPNCSSERLCSPETVIDALPEKLRRLHIYKDADSDFSLPRVRTMAGAESMRRLALMSELTELSIAPDTDGWGFLLDFFPMLRQGPLDQLPLFKLRHLAFDCETLREPQAPWEMFALVTTLRAAAAAASRMPELKAMELWKATPSSAALFRYSTKNFKPKITWRTNWKRARGDHLWQGELRED